MSEMSQMPLKMLNVWTVDGDTRNTAFELTDASENLFDDEMVFFVVNLEF